MLSEDCNENCEIIKELHRQFLAGLDVNQLNWESLLGHLCDLPYPDCIAHQRLLISLTVQFPLLKKYPLRKSYEKAFLKILLNKVEEYDIAHPALYDLYINGALAESDKSDTHFRHFNLDDKYIALRESRNIISQGTTGLYTWQGGIALAEWCIENFKLLRGKRVLELGCGIGFTSLAVCSSKARPLSYVCSDCHPDVLRQCSHNLSLNRDVLGRQEIIKVTPLDWENCSSLEPDFDVILAADVVYDSTLFDPLCETLKHFLSRDGALGILACTLRNENTLNEFISKLEQSGVQTTEEVEPVPQIFFYSKATQVKMYTVRNGNSGH